MKQIFFFFLLLLHIDFCRFFHLSVLVQASRQDPIVSQSPSLSPTSPVSTSMAALSPGAQLPMGTNEEERHYLKLDKKMALLVIVTCGSLALVILLALLACFVYYWKFFDRKKRHNSLSGVEKGHSLNPFMGRFSSVRMVNDMGSVALIDYKSLEKGTHNFGDDCILGQGGFGRVFKATLENNLHVAVKKLDCGSDDAQREFENEVNLLSKIYHPNIISLLGCCAHEDGGFIVYELMQNGSLEDQLHGPSRGSSLSWHMRLKIALDTARGLEYLHEFCKPAVIHRDLKSSNILLDSNFNAKLSDFGLAVANSSHNRSKLKLSGTVGYVAPEYMLDGELTEKSDVYAFGVVLLELLLGRRPVEKLAPAHCQSIVTWAMPQLTNRALLPNIVDPVIKDKVDDKYLFQVAAVAVLCVQPEPSYRPLITDVVHSLIPLVPLELGGTLRTSQSMTPRIRNEESVL